MIVEASKLVMRRPVLGFFVFTFIGLMLASFVVLFFMFICPKRMLSRHRYLQVLSRL